MRALCTPCVGDFFPINKGATVNLSEDGSQDEEPNLDAQGTFVEAMLAMVGEFPPGNFSWSDTFYVGENQFDLTILAPPHVDWLAERTHIARMTAVMYVDLKLQSPPMGGWNQDRLDMVAHRAHMYAAFRDLTVKIREIERSPNFPADRRLKE